MRTHTRTHTRTSPAALLYVLIHIVVRQRELRAALRHVCGLEAYHFVYATRDLVNFVRDAV